MATAQAQKSLLARNAAGDALSAGERAILRFLKTFGYLFGTQIFAALPNVAITLASHHFNSALQLISTGVGLLLAVFGLTWDKYMSAKGDTWKPLQAVGDQLITLGESALGMRSDAGSYATGDPSTPPATSANATE